MKRLLRKGLRALFGYDPAYFDMYLDKQESFFARLYLQAIEFYLSSLGNGVSLDLLDAGCQTGRLAIPLAKKDYRLVGVDTSGFALRRARQHSQHAGVGIRWIKGDIVKVLPKFEKQSFDTVLCIEVLYLRENFRNILSAFREVLKGKGLLMTSHRPQAYFLKLAQEKGDLETSRFIETHREGALWGSYFNWQTPLELSHLYRSLGFAVREIRPIERSAQEPHYLLVVAHKN